MQLCGPRTTVIFNWSPRRRWSRSCAACSYGPESRSAWVGLTRRLRPFITHFSEQAVIVQPQTRVAVVVSAPAVNKVLEAAIDGKADYVVSGDRHLLELRGYQDIP